MLLSYGFLEGLGRLHPPSYTRILLTMKEIRPTYGEGGWSSGHRFFRKAAYRARHDFQKSYTRLLLHKSESDAPVVIQDTSNPAFAGLVVPENISDPELAELRE